MNSPPSRRPTWAEIDLRALQHNYSTIKQRLREGGQLMAVVKANAYGHGAVACARALEAVNADWFGVALPEEGGELRRGGITRPIFCVGGFWQGQAEQLIADQIVPAVFRLDMVEELNARAKAAGRIVEYHLKVDTGMGRLGVPDRDLPEFAEALSKFENTRLAGVLTHFADADGAESSFTEQQIARFRRAIEVLEARGFRIEWRHMANSAGIHAYPESHGTLARAGATLYGLSRDVLAPHPEPFDLRPVMSLRSRVIMLKRVPAGSPLGYGRTFTTKHESLIATIPIGYADGLRRALSNKGEVLIRGQLAPIVGRVSMDLTILDVTGIDAVSVGDEVVLLGEQQGTRISAEDMAESVGTISYEIVTGISARVPRVYLNPSILG